MLIYIAGPYTNPEPIENTHKAFRMADELVKAGHVPYVPHMSLIWNLVSPKPVDFWYAYDLEILVRCDAVLRMEGASVGADNEVAVARAKGIPVFYSIAEIAA
jgi:nucleoside 2-deoxyribosyltransferase